jgi:hypothetical protein
MRKENKEGRRGRSEEGWSEVQKNGKKQGKKPVKYSRNVFVKL